MTIANFRFDFTSTETFAPRLFAKMLATRKVGGESSRLRPMRKRWVRRRDLMSSALTNARECFLSQTDKIWEVGRSIDSLELAACAPPGSSWQAIQGGAGLLHARVEVDTESFIGRSA